MKRISHYLTTDGKTFTDKNEAKRHEAGLAFLANVRAEYEPIFTVAPDHGDRLLTAMLAEPAVWIKALAAYEKVCRKTSPPAEPDAKPTGLTMAA